MEYYGDRTCSARWWCPAKKDTTPVANCSVVGGSRLKPPPLRYRLLCGRGIEAQTNPPHEENTDTAMYYVCCVLPVNVPLDGVWRLLRVLRVLGVASGTASGALMSVFPVMQTHRCSKMPFLTNLYAGALPLEDYAANIMHGLWPGQTELVVYTGNEVWDHMLAPIQELQRPSLRKANLSHLIPLVPRCVPGSHCPT